MYVHVSVKINMDTGASHHRSGDQQRQSYEHLF